MTETYARLKQQITDRGPWQQTATGRAFFVMDPHPQEVNLEDIAHSLSYQCRYNGHSRVFYSVAQHSMMVSKWMEEDGWDATFCLAGLHHDSSEAYTGDIVSQVKYAVPKFKDMERRIEWAVKQKFGLPMSKKVQGIIKEYDFIALATEVRDIVGINRTPYTWGDLPQPRFEELNPLTPEQAKMAFLMRHKSLEAR